MKQGDFTTLAKDYIHRTGYSREVLELLLARVARDEPQIAVADVGAGTGKLTENLIALGLSGYAVEPNDAMRAEGQRLCGAERPFAWSAGSGEATGLPSGSVDWVLMASSFHWTDPQRSLPEFHRILKPGGFFTALWNPRDLESSELHRDIERMVHERVPGLKRVSSGGKAYTQGLEQTLVSTGHFAHLVFCEGAHQVSMTPERYLGAWRSVNDIQAQAGPEAFEGLMAALTERVSALPEVVVPYRTRAWTVQAV
jgi:ubiquinone/menaquinone biosynthesis C-methylase UbiE